MSYGWNSERVEHLLAALRRHGDIRSALEDASRKIGRNITLDAANNALRRYGLTSASTWLGAPVPTPAQPKVDVPMSSDVESLVAIVRKHKDGISFEDLCDELMLHPSGCRALMEKATEAGASLDVAHGRLHFRLPEPGSVVGDVQHVPVSYGDGELNRIAVVSDLHFGSKYCLKQQFTDFIQFAYDSGIRDFFCPGDVVEGCYRHAMFERTSESVDGQCTEFLDALPELPGMSFTFIDGNHDYTFTERTGLECGRNLVRLARERGREDLRFLGSRGALIQYGQTRIELWHPLGKLAYALSYKLQNHVRDTHPSRHPHLLFTGHFHKYVKLRMQDVWAFFAPTFQHGDSAFGRAIGGDVAMGGLIVEWRVGEGGVVNEVTDTVHLAYHSPQTHKVQVT